MDIFNSLLEPAVSWMVENKNMTRNRSAYIAGFIAWFLGLFTVLSFNHWKFEFSFAGMVKENGIFDIFDILTSNIMLPLGGVLVAIFASWLMSRASTVDELGLGDSKTYKVWRFVVRYIAPLGVIIIFLHTMGFFKLFF